MGGVSLGICFPEHHGKRAEQRAAYLFMHFDVQAVRHLVVLEKTQTTMKKSDVIIVILESGTRVNRFDFTNVEKNNIYNTVQKSGTLMG